MKVSEAILRLLASSPMSKATMRIHFACQVDNKHLDIRLATLAEDGRIEKKRIDNKSVWHLTEKGRQSLAQQTTQSVTLSEKTLQL